MYRIEQTHRIDGLCPIFARLQNRILSYHRKESGLPFFETILMPALPKSAGLPVGLTQQTKKRLQDGR